jgi:hypothetical protein
LALCSSRQCSPLGFVKIAGSSEKSAEKNAIS